MLRALPAKLQYITHHSDFRLWLTESLIREDLDSLRSLARRPGVEEEPKKSKKVKLD